MVRRRARTPSPGRSARWDRLRPQPVRSECATSVIPPPRNPNITYLPLEADLSYGAIGTKWEAARGALLDAIGRFEPDVIQCFGSEWPYGAIAEDVDIPVVIHMMGFLNSYFLALDMASGPAREESVPHRMRCKMHAIMHGGHGAPVPAPKLAAFERRVMKANRYFMGRTEWDRRIVRYFSPGSSYFSMPEFMRHPFIREAGTWKQVAGETLRLLTVSSADERKGIEVILQTARLLRDLAGIDFEWRIAGDAGRFGHFEERCGIRHGDVNVRLLGLLDAEDVASELKAADLFIHPSLIDNSPRAICEAQLVGCPVIASNVGGVPQLVEDGVTGFLYPYNEPHTLAFLIADLAQQNDRLDEVSRASSRIALQRHDPALLAARLIYIYEKVVALHEE